jgi:hypothetical protein
MKTLAGLCVLLGGCWLALDFSGYENVDLAAQDDLSAAIDAGTDLAACVADPRAFFAWSTTEGPSMPLVFGPGGVFDCAAATLPVGRIFVLGGYEGGAVSSSKIWELRRNYDFMAESLVWSSFGDLPAPNHAAAAVALPDGSGLVVGGAVPGSVVWSADGGVAQISVDQPYAGANRGVSAALGPDNLPWVLGGFADGPGIATNDVAVRGADMAWVHSGGTFPPALPVNRLRAGAVHHAASVLAIGGYTNDDGGVQVATATVAELAPPGAMWTSFPDLPAAGPADAFIGNDGSLYAIIVGSFASAEPAARIYRFDVCKRVWQTGPQLDTAPMGRGAVALGLDGRIYVLGGGDRGVRIYGPRILTEVAGDAIKLWGGPFAPSSMVTLYQGTPALGAPLAQAMADASGQLAVEALQIPLSSLGSSVTTLWLMDDQTRYPLRVPVPGR